MDKSDIMLATKFPVYYLFNTCKECLTLDSKKTVITCILFTVLVTSLSLANIPAHHNNKISLAVCKVSPGWHLGIGRFPYAPCSFPIWEPLNAEEDKTP